MSEWIFNVPLYLVLGGALIAVATWAHLTYWSWHYRKREMCGALSWIYSDDGWRIALEHLPPRQGTEVRGQAICCPGLACNGRIFHLRDGLSMARSLSEEGWSVWIIHPRGTGPSERSVNEPWAPHSYDEYLHDAFVAVDFIKERAPELSTVWIGHSLGGVIGLDVVTRKPELFAGIMTLGSPIDLTRHPISARHYALFKWFCRGLKTAYLGKLSTLVAPWSGWFPFLHPKPLYVNFELLNKADLRTSLAQCFDDVPRRVLDEFVGAIEGEEGPWDRLRAELPKLRVPLLSIAGGRDGLAPLVVTTPITKVAPPERLTWHILEEYGHLELALSEGVDRDVLPRFNAWWSEVAPSASADPVSQREATVSEDGVEEDEIGPSAIA